MLTYAGLFSENRNTTNPIRRLAGIKKKFFSPFKLIKYGEYSGIPVSEIVKVQKAVEKTFSIPKFICAGIDFLDPEASEWNRTKSGLKLITSGSSSLILINDIVAEHSEPFLSTAACALIEKISALAKLVKVSCKITDIALKLLAVSDAKKEESRKWERIFSLILSLVSSSVELFTSVAALLVLFLGLVVSPLLLLMLYTFTLVLTVINRFCNTNLERSANKDAWGRLAWL